MRYFAGASPVVMARLFPPPTFEMPNDAFFEITGIHQDVPGTCGLARVPDDERRAPCVTECTVGQRHDVAGGELMSIRERGLEGLDCAAVYVRRFKPERCAGVARSSASSRPSSAPGRTRSLALPGSPLAAQPPRRRAYPPSPSVAEEEDVKSRDTASRAVVCSRRSWRCR